MTTEMNTQYDADPCSGRWLCEEEAIQLGLSLKSTVEAACKDLINGQFELLVYANSNRAINDKQQKGGRFTFTIPRSLFMQILPVRDAAIKLETGSNYNHIAIQRAPGKAIHFKLREDLTYEQKVAAVEALASNPILLKLKSRSLDSTNRLNFVVAVSNAWLVS